MPRNVQRSGVAIHRIEYTIIAEAMSMNTKPPMSLNQILSIAAVGSNGFGAVYSSYRGKKLRV